MFHHDPTHVGYSMSAAPSTNQTLWNYTTGDTVDSSPAVCDGVVYVGSQDDKVYALNATTGKQVWNYTTGGEVYSSPAVANGVVFVGSEDDKVYAFGSLAKVPEFPSCLILPVFMVATLVAALVLKKKRKDTISG
jgi:hypothetical protein